MSTRETMLKAAVESAIKRRGDAMTFRDICFDLPGDFWRDPDTGERYSDDSIQAEVNAACEAIEIPTRVAGEAEEAADPADVMGTSEPEPPSPRDTESDPAELKFDPVTGGTVARAPTPPAAAPTPQISDRQRAHDRMTNAAKALDAARFETSRARERWKIANEKLRLANVALATGSPNPMTFEQNVRDYLHAQTLERHARVAGEAWATPATRKGRASYLDVAASYARGSSGDPNAAARSRMRTGYHRGAFGAHMQGQTNRDPSRGNVPKLPSER